MVLLQEYGDSVLIEGETPELVRAFERANDRWADQLGVDSVFGVRTHADGIELRAHGVIGQLSVRGHSVEIAPKYIKKSALNEWRSAVFDVLQFSQPEAFEFTGPGTGTLADNSFADLLARGFLQALEPALNRGVPTEYERIQERRETLDGELVVDRLYPQVVTDPSRLWIETSELTSDTVLGRALRFAARRFAALTTIPELRGRLRNIESRLTGVDPTPPSVATLDRYFLAPQHRPFEDAFDIAAWLIRGRGTGLGGETTAVEGVLLKSHRIYQTFVHRCLEHVAREHGWRVDDEPELTIAEGPSTITAYPDHLLKTDSTTVVLDSKYKGSTKFEAAEQVWTQKPSPSDTNQVTMAGRAVGAHTVGLIYPAQTPSDNWTITSSGRPEQLHALTLDPLKFHRDRDLFFESLTTSVKSLVDTPT